MIPVVDNEIVIDKALWASLNAKYSKQELIEAIANTIIDQKLPMPMRKITWKEARDDANTLAFYPAHELFREDEWFSRYEYDPKWWFQKNVVSTASVGSKASDYFQQENRWLCDSINSPSPYRTWHTKKFLLTLLPALWSMKFEEVNNDVLRSCISLRKYIASQFRPSAAKVIIDHFKGERVLDFSSGWGDRLAGFMASNAYYYMGVDPNLLVHKGYQAYLDKLQCSGTIVEMCTGGAEDMSYKPNNVDLVFTSPPYFNIEHYTKNSDQSYKKFKKLDQWLNGFLFKSIDNAWGSLKSGGHMVINISDVYSNHQIHRICNPMNEFISTLEGAVYEGAIGYEMRKRPNSGALKGKTGVFAEPMWVWRKI